MPRVGRREYPYTPAGEKAAQAESKRTGKPMQYTEGPQKGKTGPPPRRR